MKIAVTGGAGFIGSHVCERLLARGHSVMSLDNFNAFYDPALKRRNVRETARVAPSRFKSLKVDIRDGARMGRIIKKFRPDTVIHLAAMAGVRPSLENPLLYEDVNVRGTHVLLDLCAKQGIKRFIFASSSSVYGNNRKVPFSENDRVDHPISPYAATKKAGELLCHTYAHLNGMAVCCLRFFTVYGPRQRPDLAIHKFTKLIQEKRSLPYYGDGSTRRDYTYIDDIVSGVLGALAWVRKKTGGAYGVFNLGESRTVTLREMVRTLENVIGKKAVLRNLPLQPGDVSRTFADVSRARRELSYKPSTEFRDGIELFLTWYRKINGDGASARRKRRD